jgi:hypothetical protein
MASKYSTGYQRAYVTVPSEKIAIGEYSGEVKSLYTEYVASGELATTDTLYLGKLPPGARVIGGMIKCPASGATGILDVGYQANGVDSVDLNAFVESADPGAAAVAAQLAGAGVGKKFTVETVVVCTPSEITASLDTLTLQVWLNYVVD